MVRKIRTIAFAFALFSLQMAYSQDPELTQFYAAPVYTNPALTGSAVCEGGREAAGRFSLNYRNQWPQLPGTFRSLAATWDQHIPVVSGGLGVMFFRDVAGSGLLTTTTVAASYSYLLPIQLKRRKQLFMRFGVQPGFTFKSLDFSKLRFGDQINPTQGFVLPTGEAKPSQNINYPNVNGGWIMYTSKFYAGFAVHNIIEPNWSFYNTPDEVLPRRYTVHGGAVIPLTKERARRGEDQSAFSPNMLFMMQRNFSQLNLGFYVNRGPLVTGLWFRQTFGQYATSDALMVLLGFRKGKFKFGYSFDFTVSDGRSAIPYSHEVSATVDWCIPPGKRPFKPLKCPEF